MSVPLSLFDELTQQNQPKFPVTELLTQLLQTVGHDVCSTKRNLHSSYWTVAYARDLCDKINALAAVAAEGESWTRFDEYTTMIVYLEELLYDFSLVAEKESVVTKLPTNDKIQNDLAFIDIWRDSRKDLRLTMKRLLDSNHFGSEAGTHSAEITAIHRHDDSALLKSICQQVSMAKLPNSAKTRLPRIQNQLNTIQAALVNPPENLPDDVVVYSTQTAMVIEIITSGRDSQIADRMRSPELWGKTERLVNLVEKHAKDATLPPAILAQAWSEFRTYLTTGVVVELPGTYNALRGLVAQIRRPYYERSLRLVSGCVELAPIFGKTKTFAMLTPLQLALDNTTTALTAAAGVTYDPNIAWSEDEDMDPQGFEEKFTTAKGTDTTRLDLLHKRFKSSNVATKSGDLTKLVVTIPNVAEPAKSTSRTYSFESNTTLSAVLWKEASLAAAGQRNAIRAKGYFESGGGKLSLDTELGMVPEIQGKRSVTLIVPT
ncbi:hypothetical protein B0H11DRAFT_2343422 [Mycena galericulata]|nr:hypothetical protein B0H11DRAFT_2343422 [Mycena galericulata]